MAYILIHQSLFVHINRSDELSVWQIKRSQLYKTRLLQFHKFPLLDLANKYGENHKGAMLPMSVR